MLAWGMLMRKTLGDIRWRHMQALIRGEIHRSIGLVSTQPRLHGCDCERTIPNPSQFMLASQKTPVVYAYTIWKVYRAVQFSKITN